MRNPDGGAAGGKTPQTAKMVTVTGDINRNNPHLAGAVRGSRASDTGPRHHGRAF
jgi:hypothetical protein